MKSYRDEIFRFVKEKFGTVPDYPWENSPEYAVLRHKNNKKWYGLVMGISKKHLGFDTDEFADVINVKCPPDLIGSLLKNDGYFPAYHMNKENWITAALDGSVEIQEIFNLINLSFELTEK